MADERLIKQLQIVGKLLDEAAAEINQSPDYREYRHFMDHREFELALDVLEAVGGKGGVTRDYWWRLKKAAEAMGLRGRLSEYRRRIRGATEGA